MKTLALALLLCLLPACVVHLHFHEAPKTAEVQSPHSRSESRATTISGVVLDAQGRPVRAHVAAVGPARGGSNTVGTDDTGLFELPWYSGSDFVLHASTSEGQVAVQPGRSSARDLELVLRPGMTLAIDLAGHEHARCAVFQGELRIEDFTLHAGKPANVVVAPGEVRVRLYEGDQIFEEQSLNAAEGLTKALSFKIGS